MITDLETHIASPDLVIAWGCLLTFNTIIVILTAHQSYKLRDTYSKELIVIMFRDGKGAILHFVGCNNLLSRYIAFSVCSFF